MKLIVQHRAAAVMFALGALSICGPANAGRTEIDGSGEAITTICAIGASTACTTPTALKASSSPSPLVANFGFGPFSSVYIYNNGLVSIGAAIAPGANLSSLASIGGNVFTAGYSPTTTLSNFQIQGPNPALVGPNAGNTVVRVYYDAAFGNTTQRMEFNIFDLGSGNYELSLNHGNPFDTGPVPFPADAYLGYSFNGVTVQESGTALQTKVSNEADFRYRFSATGTPAVPEPSAWAMLILGFVGIGTALRQQRRTPAFAR